MPRGIPNVKPEAPPGVKPERKPRTSPKRKGAVKKDMCAAVVQFIAIPVGILSPAEAIQPNEFAALTQALYDAAESNVYIANIILTLTGVGGVGELVAVTGAVVTKRVVQRAASKIPEGTNNRQTQTLQVVYGAAELIINGVASRGASPDLRSNGQRQNGAGSENTGATEVRYNPVAESRPPAVDGVEASEASE